MFGKSLLNAVVTLACFCLIGLSTLVSYWLFWPYEAVDYKTKPIPVLQEMPADVASFDPKQPRPVPVFKPGDRIFLLHDYCRLMEAPVTANIEIIDTAKLPIPYSPSQSAVGCQKRVSNLIRIPEFFYSREPVTIHITLRYQVNPLRTITYHIESEPFFVKE